MPGLESIQPPVRITFDKLGLSLYTGDTFPVSFQVVALGVVRRFDQSTGCLSIGAPPGSNSFKMRLRSSTQYYASVNTF